MLGLSPAVLRIGRGTGQGRPAPGFGAKSSQRHPIQHRCPHRFGKIPPGSRRSDGVSKELYLQFISGTPVVRYSEAGKRTSERIYLSLCGMTHLRISSPHEEVVLIDQTVGSDVAVA